MGLTQLKAFNAVAAHGSFVKAAAALNRTQPTVTTLVRLLEQRYGVQLVNRQQKKVLGLTPIGQQLRDITQHIFTLERDAVALLNDAGRGEAGLIRVAAIAPKSAIRFVQPFRESHPRVDLSLTFGNSESILSKLLNGDVDIGLIGGHEGSRACVTRVFSQPEIVLIAHMDYPFARSDSVDRQAFRKATLLMREQGSETRGLMLAQMHRHRYVAGQVIEIGSREGVLQAAIAGMGLAAVSLDEIDLPPSMRIVRFKGFNIFGVLHAVCLRSRAETQLIRQFMRTSPASIGGGTSSSGKRPRALNPGPA